MFNQKGLDLLKNGLSKKGYTGNEECLLALLSEAEEVTKLFQFDLIIENFKKNSSDNKNFNNIDYVSQLVYKCNSKYKDNSINIDFPRMSLTFYSNKEINDNKCSISFYFFDNTNRSYDGILGSSGVRLLYGYDDHRKEKIIIFKDEMKDEEY
jgi:hypothetical protein